MAQVFMSALDENDFVVRRQKEAREMVYPVERYEHETVRTTLGPKDTPVDIVLRYAARPTHQDMFIFACYADNPAWHRRPEVEWNECAKRALTKFAAMRDGGRVVKAGPMPERGRPLNWQIDLQGGKVDSDAAD